MTIEFHPRLGAVLMCDFTTGFRLPEMVKNRPVVVISRKHRDLCTVVPLSTVEPSPVEPCHHKLSEHSLPFQLTKGRDVWAKCDMITTVGFGRLDRILIGRDRRTGRRQYASQRVNRADLRAIRAAVLHVLALNDLIWPEK